MPVPSLSDLITPTSTNNGLSAETVEERLCTLACMLASGTAPDGTALPNYGGGTRPSFKAWRVQSVAIPGTTTIPAGSIRERTMAALSAWTIRTNPDGTTF